MESERDIEQMLRTWAHQRRGSAGTPFEMHPATRELLRGEVRRTYGQSTAAPPAQTPIWNIWRPRLAWVGGVAAALGILAILWLPHSALMGTKTTVASPKEQGNPVLPISQFARLALRDVQPLAPAEPAAKPAETNPSKALEQRMGKAKAMMDLAFGPGSQPTGGARRITPPINNSLLAASRSASNQNVPYQAYTAPAPDSGLKSASGPDKVVEPTSTPLLQRFEIERDGGRLRLIDQDGSIYAGDMVASTATAIPTSNGTAGMTTAKEFLAATGAPDQNQMAATEAGMQVFLFHASGTNQSSRLPVAMDGWLELAAVMDSSLNKDGAKPLPTQSKPGPGGIRRFQAKVTVGANHPFEINAAPAGH